MLLLERGKVSSVRDVIRTCYRTIVAQNRSFATIGVSCEVSIPPLLVSPFFLGISLRLSPSSKLFIPSGLAHCERFRMTIVMIGAV